MVINIKYIMEKKRTDILLELIAEVMLSFLPMMIVILVLLQQDKLDNLFLKPEWAFASAIFFGQSIVRLVSLLAQKKKTLNAGFLSFFVVLLILFGLGPSCAIVVIVLIYSEHSLAVNPTILYYSIQVIQVLLYLLSAVAYVFVSATAKELEHQDLI